MRELFVYYRVAASDHNAAVAAVRAFHSRLVERHPGLLARLLVRHDSPDTPRTLMETYATDPQRRAGGVDADLQAAIESEAAALAPWLLGPRHTEVFTACA